MNDSTQTIDRPTPTRRRTVLAVEGLTKTYGDHTVVDSLAFEVPAGQVVGLLGPNGAGKTTAMKMLVGLVRPTSGRATVLGTGIDSPEFAHALRRVGTLIESPALYEQLSARRNLELQARVLGVNAGRNRIDELLDMVDLAGRADDRAKTYSLGMKQRLGIAVAMIGHPELVILDEPANGLDPAGIVEIRQLLRRLPELGTTVLVSSHQLAEVQQACDSVVVLNDGRLIADGTTEDLVRAHDTNNYTVRLDPAEVDAAVDAVVDLRLPIEATTGDSITVMLPAGWTGRELNRTLVTNDVFATEIHRNSVTLEEAFLAMTRTEGTHHVER